MPVSGLLSGSETVASFAFGIFFVWLAWGPWRLARRTAARTAERVFMPSLLLPAGLAIWAAGFMGLGGLSIAYPFDLHGRMHPPAHSLAAVAMVVCFATLPAGVALLALAAWLAARTAR